MPSDVSPNNPTYYNRKTIPQTGRIRKQKDSIIRIEDETDMKPIKTNCNNEKDIALIIDDFLA